MLCALFVLLALADNSCKQTLDATVVALQQKNPVRAKSILESAPAECGQVSSFYELTGVTDNLNGDSARAEQDFERAVALHPQEPRLLAELGTIYLKNGKVKNAADVLSQALKLNPSNSEIGKYLIAAYVGLNRWQDVAETFDKLGAGRKPGILDPPVMILWFARALIETKRLGQIDKLLSPTQPGMTSPVLFSLGQLFAEHGMYSQVVRFLRQIPARDADDAASFNLGLAYSHLKRFDLARRFYFEAIDKHPGHLEAYLHVGLDYASLGDPRRAVPWMARAHQFAPDRTDISYALTEQLLLLDYVRSAEEVLTNTMKANPSDPLLLVAEGDLKAAESQHAAAVEFYQEALVQQPASIAALVGLSRANILQGNEDQARTYLQRALAVDPGNSAANATLGLMELHQGNWELAITHLRSSWEKDQSNSEVLLGLARAYRRADRTGDALGVLAAVDSGVRNTPAFHLELSQVYSQLHRTQDAKKEQESFRALQANTRGSLRFDKPQSYVF